MGKYVHLLSWTEQGVRGYADTVKRAEAAADAWSRMGGKLVEVYWTLGPYNIVVLSEFRTTRRRRRRWLRSVLWAT